MNDILKEFTDVMLSKGLNYNNVKQCNLLVESTIDESMRSLVKIQITDSNKEQFEIKDLMQKVKVNEVINGWVSFDNYGWIERDEANGIEFWEYKFYPILPEEVTK
jgi:hypothetical protein